MAARREVRKGAPRVEGEVVAAEEAEEKEVVGTGEGKEAVTEVAGMAEARVAAGMEVAGLQVSYTGRA